MYIRLIKRVIDFIFALLGLIVLSPIVILIVLILAIVNNGSPFFFQKRPGKGENIFKVIKFKTMNDKKDVNGILLPDSSRLTKVGIFIRKTSLDELPQLINVLKGDMSLIGPRPLLAEYLPLYNENQKRRHDVRPGITGWAQINGRNAISWSEKFELDIYYVQNISFSLDLKILLRTIIKVVLREGISSQTSATMDVFEGEK
jgi:undecaprenyl phosphate N,N'-diacetylbacillosamine 1-phosphate transferase